MNDDSHNIFGILKYKGLEGKDVVVEITDSDADPTPTTYGSGMVHVSGTLGNPTVIGHVDEYNSESNTLIVSTDWVHPILEDIIGNKRKFAIPAGKIIVGNTNQWDDTRRLIVGKPDVMKIGDIE